MSGKQLYQDSISREGLTRELWRDVLILCVVILFVRSLFQDSHGDHWLFGPLLDGMNYIVGTAAAALLIVAVIPDKMRLNLSLISSAI